MPADRDLFDQSPSDPRQLSPSLLAMDKRLPSVLSIVKGICRHRVEQRQTNAYKPRLHYNVLGTACAWNGATFFRHGTARLHLSFCCAGLKSGTGPSTGAILTAHTDFFNGTAPLSVYTCVKAGTARLIGVPWPTYLVVLGTAKNLGTSALPAPFILSEFAVPCPKQSGTSTKILAVPCPKRYSGVIVCSICITSAIRSVSDRSQFALRKCSHSFRSISVCFEKVFTLV